MNASGDVPAGERAVARTSRLTLIGYWDGPDTDHSWPNPETMVDDQWDPFERQLVESYLAGGVIVQSFMGLSQCRMCGRDNGALELTDGTYVWPDGLGHYISDHGVRLPDRFVDHALRRIETLEESDVDRDWWRTQRYA